MHGPVHSASFEFQPVIVSGPMHFGAEATAGCRGNFVETGAREASGLAPSNL